jgi:hypothetical protein
MLHSVIRSGDDSWLREQGPIRARSLATVKTLLIPTLNMGQAAEMLDIIDITEKQPEKYNEDVKWGDIKAKWGPVLEEDYKNKKKQYSDYAAPGGRWEQMASLFKNISSETEPLNFLSLKQYRDSKQADRACYQSLVLLRKNITSIFNIEEMHNSVHVLIHRYPTLPIVETLGLKVQATNSEQSSVVDWLEPIRPFFMHVSLKDELGIKVCGRVNSKDWDAEDDDSTDRELIGEHTAPTRIRFDLSPTEKEEARKRQEQKNEKQQQEYRERLELLENIHEPKAVIEYLLSNGFGASIDKYIKQLDEHRKNRKEQPIYPVGQEFGQVDEQVEATNARPKNRDL